MKKKTSDESVETSESAGDSTDANAGTASTSQSGKPTPYDDAFKTMVQDLPRLLIKFTGRVFGKEYAGDETITYATTEIMVPNGDGTESKRLLDSKFTIHGESESTNYHLECQSTSDSSLWERFWEYDAPRPAKDEVPDAEGTPVFWLPASAVLYLRPPAYIGDKIRAVMRDHGDRDQRSVRSIKVIRPHDFTAETILDEANLFVFPFYLFKYEKQLKSENEEERKAVLDELEALAKGLHRLEENKVITFYESATLRRMTRNIADHLVKDQEIKIGVQRLMGGNVLEYPEKRILNEGIQIGTERGIQIGTERGIQIGTERGIQIGTERGAEKAVVGILTSWMMDKHLDFDQAYDMLPYPASDRKKYKVLVEKALSEAQREDGGAPA